MINTHEKQVYAKYPFYKNIIESKGYEFKFHQHPYDVYSDNRNEIRICVPCNILRFNEKRINNPGQSGSIRFKLTNKLFIQ